MRSPTRPATFGCLLLLVASFGCSDADRIAPTVTEPSLSPSLSKSPERGPVKSVTISPANDTVVVGARAQLTATARDARGRTVTTAPITWSSADTTIARVSSSGVVTGMRAGGVVITAASQKVSGAVNVTVVDSTAAPPPPTPGTWTFCTAAGAMCQFNGLRDVRLGGPQGGYVQLTAYGLVPCASYGFNNQNPAPGKALHCDYGAVKVTTLANPQPGMANVPAVVTVPLGAPGLAGQQLRASTYTPAYIGTSGAFRTQCDLAKYAFDDPIVFPGQPGASHLHMFFGNAGINAAATPQSLAGGGNSTCGGGTVNRSAYWMPALIDSRTGRAVTPAAATVYYKTGYDMDPAVIQPPPAGLRMIAGDKTATALQPNAYWSCTEKWIPNSATVPTTCSVGVRLLVIFPQCWDGQNLDAPDHKSHMAVPVYSNNPKGSTCPATHPVALPEITEIYDFPIPTPGAPAYWRLASDMYGPSIGGGMSAHADWIGGWDPTTMKTIVTQCLNKGLDCGVNVIGNGQELY